MDSLAVFCRQIRARSAEHRCALGLLHRHDLSGQVISILRQELDSMVRTIYLLSIDDLKERTRLIRRTLANEKWTVKTPRGRSQTITDRDMVELANALEGWTEYVYKFGCAFIHLSAFHLHETRNPFLRLPERERADIIRYLRHYHGGLCSDSPSMHELAWLLPDVFRKISSNLDSYLKELENGASIVLKRRR